MIWSRRTHPLPGPQAALMAAGAGPCPWVSLGERSRTQLLAGSNILLLGFETGLLALMREELRRNGSRTVSAAAEVERLNRDPLFCGGFDWIILDFDRFADVEDGIDTLMSFRRLCPAAGVVLVSRTVAADDTGGERRAICDATLRNPLTPARLSAALASARDNRTVAGANRWR